MRRVIGRLLVALAIAVPVPVLFMSAAHGQGAYGPAVIKCMHWKDDMHISPGVSNSPAGQTVSAHGRLFGCNKAGGGAQFQGNFQMSGATCANLAMSGSATFDWTNGTHSTAFLMFHPQALEPNKFQVDGTITSGMFDGLVVTSWLRFTQVFGGSGAPCTSSNTLNKLEFTNSQSFQLQAPQVATTTRPTPTNPPPTTPRTTPRTTPPRNPPPTVPITNQGSIPSPATTQPPVTIIINECCVALATLPRVPPTGTLAFTGSSSLAALFGFEALLIGGAFACLDPERKERRLLRVVTGASPKAWLRVTLPPSPMR